MAQYFAVNNNKICGDFRLFAAHMLLWKLLYKIVDVVHVKKETK